MAEKTFYYDELPAESKSGVSEGEHILTIQDVKEIWASTGTYMYQFTYQIDETQFQLKMDNCPLESSDGQKIDFGRNKLKRILDATNVKPKEFSIRTIKPLLVNKKFKAVLTKNEKGYLELRDISTIKGIEQEAPVEGLGEEEVVINTQANTVTQKRNW